jgi:release factor glutamine methyltransferase
LGEAISRLGIGDSFLEIGLGSGNNLKVATEKFRLIVGTDILPLKSLLNQRSAQVEIIRADKATCFREAVFDLVAFNPPYLPSEIITDWSIDGGPQGVEIPLEFLESAMAVLKPNGTVLLLLSSLGATEIFEKYCADNSLIAKKIAETKLFFETLTVYLITRTKA